MSNNFLSEEHRDMLESGSAISPEVITDRGYRTVKVKSELCFFEKSQFFIVQ